MQNNSPIPRGMENYAQFINWKLTHDRDTGNFLKMPCNGKGEVIDAHDPKNHMSASVAMLGLVVGLGVAFVLTAADNFWCIDIDHCRDLTTQQFDARASNIYHTFPGAAAEISQSGTGLHLFGRGTAPSGHRCKNVREGVEFYTEGRFIALTGIEAHGDANIDFTAQIPEFLERWDLTPLPPALPISETGVDPRYTFEGDDDALIAAMLASDGGPGVAFGDKVHPRALWDADKVALGRAFPGVKRAYDASSADAALHMHLAFWTGRDGPRMQRLFERSGLMREKWRSRPDYVRRTIAKAISLCTRVYDRPRAGAEAVPLISSTYLRIEQQIELFRGCVYVQDRHAVMLPDGRVVKPEVFRVIYGGRSFQMRRDNTGSTRNAFEAFTENQLHRFPMAKSVCFHPGRMPGEIVNDDVNLWVPPVVDEQPGDVQPFLDHVAKILPDERDRKILLNYLKSAAQNMGVKFQWAPVVQGAEGNGKTLFTRCMRHALSDRYIHMPKASEVSEKYNSWVEQKLFISVEEIYIADRREVLEILKDTITNERIEIRGMGREKRMVDNCANWFLTTNHKDAVPVNDNQRRWCIFYTAQQTAADLLRDGMDEDYFIRLYGWLENGGYAAVAYWLRHTPIDPEFDPAEHCKRAPRTSSSNEAITNSYGRYEQTIIDAIEACRPGFCDGWISTTAVEALFDEKRLPQMHTRKIAQVLDAINYRSVGRASKTIMAEGKQPIRPRLYRRGDLPDGTTDEFMKAQGYAG